MPEQPTVGKVIEIKGVVIDALFTENLPEINTALEIAVPSEDGQDGVLIAEVQQHLGEDRDRPVARARPGGARRPPTAAPRRAAAPPAAEKPTWVPVGKATLGRIFNGLGEP